MRGWSLILAVAVTLCASAAPVTVEVHRTSDACAVTSFTLIDESGHAKTVAPTSSIEVSAFPVRIAAVAQGCWSDTANVTSSAARVVIDVSPAATLQGAVLPQGTNDAPKAITGTFVDAQSALGDEHVLDCELRGKTWRCKVPAGRPMHVKLAIDDFAPLLLWDTEVAVGKDLDTGTHPLVHGASVAGRVVTDKRRPIEKATITLLPATSAHLTARDRVLTNSRAKTNAGGYFQIAGIEPGRYRIVSTAEGRPDATLDSFEIAEGQHLRLDVDVVHPAFAKVDVILQPPVSPSQQPWRVKLSRSGERMFERVTVAESPANAAGVWSRDKLQPAPYFLDVLDVSGSQVASQPIVLSGGPEQVVITISTIVARGVIRSGDEGVAADLWFDQNGRRVKAKSDEHGEFTTTFPKPGAWLPTVFLGPGGAQTLHLSSIDVHSPQEDTVTLHIPGGGVKGKVLRDGQGVEAVVAFMRDQRIVGSVRTAEDGTFAFHGLEKGSWAVRAEADEAFAGPLPIDVPDDDFAEIELHVEGLKEIKGVVLTPTGAPATGAVVRMFDPATARFEDTIADGRGMYAVKVKPQQEAIDLIVLQPPYPIAIRRLLVRALRAGSTVNLQLVATGARLRVIPPGNTPPWPTFATADGAVRSLRLLLMPQFGNIGLSRELIDGAYQFHVEPGAYVVCGDNAMCKSVDLAPNAVVLVNLYVPPKKAEGSR